MLCPTKLTGILLVNYYPNRWSILVRNSNLGTTHRCCGHTVHVFIVCSLLFFLNAARFSNFNWMDPVSHPKCHSS
uniref:Uncharacterized protein n=1 Tax=Octopus bimaculoides TaxID=37653 RepID=A0A0L8I9R8_OCTBM